MNQNQEITITGTALNAKAGAVVKSEDGTYYIYDLSAWPDSIYNHQVEVKGILSIIDHSKENLKDDDDDWSQGMRGEQRIVKQAQWTIKDNN